jgi:DNA repair exonuclease SbcCD ATPase subunit
MDTAVNYPTGACEVLYSQVRKPCRLSSVREQGLALRQETKEHYMARRTRRQPPRTIAEVHRLISKLQTQQQEFHARLSVLTEQQVVSESAIETLNRQHLQLAEKAFPLLAERDALKAELESIRRNPKYRRMWTSWNGAPTKEGRKLIEDRTRKLAELQDRIAALTPLDSTSETRIHPQCYLLGAQIGGVSTPYGREARECSQQLVAMQRLIQATTKAIEQCEARIEEARAQLTQLEARQQRREKEKAVVAQAMGKSRERAEAVKKLLTKTELCPYCGCCLGDEPHADHIYPQSKGGLSVARNMVYVCQQCNTQKSDLTLFSFIELFSLDRAKIEAVLRGLGKDF